MMTSYFRFTDVAIIVFDICQRSSFESIVQWMDRASEVSPGAVFIVVGEFGKGNEL